MPNQEEIENRRIRMQEDGNMFEKSSQNTREENIQTRQQEEPEILTNPIYTPAFLREQIGKLMRIEFLIGTNNMVDRVGFLEEVGASYILLRSFEGDSLIYADIYAIKFITISAGFAVAPSFPNYNNFQNMNMNNNMCSNMNRYY